MNRYVGNTLQIYGVEEMRLSGGRGDGMRILSVRNSKGLEFTVSLDRCADVSRLSLKGDNFGYFAPCGYVSPKYYDSKGNGFLKSFTAGFFTTCGLTAVGTPCTDDGQELPLHGTISNTPCENVSHWIENNKIHIKVIIRDASLFSHQLILEREYICPVDENVLYLTDKIKNIGSSDSPLEVLYHCNVGYPLLYEDSIVTIPSENITPRNKHAEAGIDRCLAMEAPQKGYEERCYYHTMRNKPTISIFNEKIGKGLEISYDTAELKYFTEWKMMGEYEYVLGLEPGNCLPDGRKAMRDKGVLEILKAGGEKTHHLKFEFIERT